MCQSGKVFSLVRILPTNAFFSTVLVLSVDPFMRIVSDFSRDHFGASRYKGEKMSDISDVDPLICISCKFSFDRPGSLDSTDAVCPVCGATVTYKHLSPRIPSPTSETFSSSIPSIRPPAVAPKDWKILLITVCFQFVVFILGVCVILSSFGKLDSPRKNLADKQTEGIRAKGLMPSKDVAKTPMQLTSLTRLTSVPAPAKPTETVTTRTTGTSKLEEKLWSIAETSTPKPDEKNPKPIPLPGPEPDKMEEERKASTILIEPEKAVAIEPRPLTYEERLHQAKITLAEAGILYTTDSAKGLQLMTQAVGLYRELGQTVPPEAYWILGQSFAAQSWGESILDGFPPIENLSVSVDGRWLLTSGMDRIVRIWDFSRRNTGEEFKLDVVDAPLVKLLFTPDLRLAIAGTVEGKIYLWDTTFRNPAESVIVLPNPIQGLREIQVSPDGRWLVAYGGSPNHSLTQLQKDRKPGPFPNSLRRTLSEEIVTVAWQNASGIIEKGPNAPSRHDQNAVWLWDLHGLQSKGAPPTVVLRGHEKQIRAMAISDDSRWLVTGGEDAEVRLYDLKAAYPGTEQMVLKGHRLDVTALAIAPDNAWIASGSRDNTIRIWKWNGSFSSANPTILEGHLGWITSLVVDGAGKHLISGSYDKTIRIWTLPKDRLDHPIPSPMVIHGDQGAIRELAVTKDGKKLVSLGIDAGLRVHALDGNPGNENSLVIRNRTLPITKFAFSPDDRWLIFNYDNLGNLANSGVRMWPLQLDDLLEIVKNEL